jgi:3-isopropylmalate/(R)-2-methylmalate dehydratase large subunit
MTSPRTLFEKLWDAHVVRAMAPGIDLLHVDRHLLHDLVAGGALEALQQRGVAVHNPELCFSTPDHLVETRLGRTGGIAPWADKLIDLLRAQSRQHGIRLFDVGEDGQGIVHVMGPELGLTLPGLSLVCGDSHTCTHGALGALAWGIGTTEVQHVLATQTLVQRRPKTMRVLFEGSLAPGVGAKDMILALIGKIGAAGGTGYAIEYAGPAVRALGMEARLTLCNLTIEAGSKFGLVAPDETTIAWIAGRRFAPRGETWEAAVGHWRTLVSDDDAQFDRSVVFDCDTLEPQITWGTSPEQVAAVGAAVPALSSARDDAQRAAWSDAMGYMDLHSGDRLIGTPIQRVFIGSCTNSRLSDLRDAAAAIRGRRVAPNVEAWVVPGSQRIQQEAEAEGLHRVFEQSGFKWRAPGCSMCVGANGELVAPGQRCVSTSNRNFVGRQGPGARTHLASPVTAVACAIAGVIADPRAN